METNRPLQRITGTEMEWGGMISPPGTSSHLQQADVYEFMPHIDQYLSDQDMPYIENFTGNYYMANGSRFYNDIGQSREYATPEDDSFIGTTANEIVSEEIFGKVAELYTDDTGHRISFTKRVIDDNRESRGYHASYAVDAKKIPINENSLALFGVFAATRAILFGSGALLPDGQFTVAQKTLTVASDFYDGTTISKPVVNLRKEPLANRNTFSRVHDTSGDPTMSPWATRVKLGAASVVLKMIESGITLESLRFEDNLSRVARIVAYDTSLTERFKLVNGAVVTALDVQDRLVYMSRQLTRSDEVQFSNEELWTIDEWERALADLRQDPRRTIDRIDWTMRREVLHRQHERHGWGWNSQQLRYKDRQFSEVALDGIALALRETVWAKHMPPEYLIKHRMHNAPESTRASVRGSFIKQVGELGLEYHSTADWVTLTFMKEKIELQDPYQHQNKKVEKLLSRIRERYGPNAIF